MNGSAIEVIGGTPSSDSGWSALATGAGAVLGGPVGAFIGAGLGSLVGGSSARQSAERRRVAQNEWEEYMRKTAHQHEQWDLRRAGLNPILTATGGAGGSWHGQSMQPIEDIVTPAISSAVQAGRTAAEMKSIALQQENIEADTKFKQTNTLLNKTLANQATAQTGKIDEERRNVIEQRHILQEQLTQHKASAERARTEQEIDQSDFGTVLRWINRFMESVRGIRGGVNQYNH